MLSSKDPISYISTVQNLLVSGCETLTAVLGMTSIVSLICYYIGKLFQWFLLSEDYDEDKSIGTVSAILFYILALQTGLTSLPPEKRFIRLCRNFCLLITALLHFLHNIVAPILMSLSAARNPSRRRHARALCVCFFLLAAPILLLAALWSRHSPSTWLLAVTAFSIEVIVKVLVSLATYTLFLLDARRQTFWEKLDDYVYYIKAFGNSVEFCFGIFLFFNGAWILLFESGLYAPSLYILPENQVNNITSCYRRCHSGAHDGHPCVLQHLVWGTSWLGRFHETTNGRSQDLRVARSYVGAAAAIRRRLCHLLPGTNQTFT